MSQEEFEGSGSVVRRVFEAARKRYGEMGPSELRVFVKLTAAKVDLDRALAEFEREDDRVYCAGPTRAILVLRYALEALQSARDELETCAMQRALDLEQHRDAVRADRV